MRGFTGAWSCREQRRALVALALEQAAAAVEIIPPSRPYDADITVPGSKSFTNRALLIAAMARGRSIVKGILKSDDSYWMIDSLRRLGIDIRLDGETAEIQGCEGTWPNPSAELFVGSAGTSARFLPGALAAAPRGAWIVDGSDQLRGRPIAPLLQALRWAAGSSRSTATTACPCRCREAGSRAAGCAFREESPANT